jgi:hypothetical protein
MNQAEFNGVWVFIVGSWPFAALKEPTTKESWRVGLDDLDRLDVIDGVKAELKASDRLPSVAAIRRAANDAARNRRLSVGYLEAPVLPIPERFRGDWQRVREMVALGPLDETGAYADEYLCEHGIGHPRPGVLHHGGGVHGCDGCCIDRGHLDDQG